VYELRAEAIGYRPLVARTLEASGGDVLRVPLELTMAQPPVVEVDTVRLESVTAGGIRPGGVRLGAVEIAETPHRFDDLASVVGLSTQFGPELGAQGLPGSMSPVVADGVPVHRAPHPFLQREHLADAFFP